ncbi:MAG: T9SS type A sorting domain-containing protein [Bacteroidales bacterium]|nr:T9SS type A sorting domain-containing protein [Bacteroidales bacterium]
MRLILSILFLCCLGSSFAQEVLVGLEMNPVIQAKAAELNRLKDVSNGLDTVPMELPFFDDFREATIFPSDARWIDNYAFVNTDIPVYPVNRGAVTLDAISDSGQMYPIAVPGPTTFLADHLTSRYIRLDSIFTPAARALTPADSVYLSFWYQPEGRGKPPHVADSLMLRFLVTPEWDSITSTDTTHIDAVWQEIWRTQGMSLDTFYIHHNQYFVQVMIPIVDTQFFRKKFRFQFYNYVSLASSAEPSWQSNCSQWNLDEIYLNINRSTADTLRPEITFIERSPSMLKTYTSMPFPQYTDNPTNEMSDTLDILISNRDLIDHNSTYGYTMQQVNGVWLSDYSGGQYVIKPFYTYGYVTYIPFAHPPVLQLFPISAADSATFLITHHVEAVDGSLLGDTMQAYQRFYNYFAYDDGTPDAGYGLTPAGSLLAYRFKLNKTPDTLRAVQFLFNRTLSGNNVQFFYLKIWNDANGKPDQVMYEELVRPRFADSLNKFVTYHLDPPLRVSNTFYVGWEQTTNDNLNLGFDRYNNSREQILFNVSGQWLTSTFNGSLMIRPIVGKPIPLGIPERRDEIATLKIYPNPASGEVQINLPGSTSKSEVYTIQLYNLFGQEVLREIYGGKIDVSGLGPGIYIVTLSGSSRQVVGTAKLVVNR